MMGGSKDYSFYWAYYRPIAKRIREMMPARAAVAWMSANTFGTRFFKVSIVNNARPPMSAMVSKIVLAFNEPSGPPKV